MSHNAASVSTKSNSWNTFVWCVLLVGLTLITLLVHGYHPLAEDGGLYVAGIEWKLNPALFPHDAAFVTEHLRFSIFASVIAALVRVTHLSLDWCLLLVELTSIALTLLAARNLLRRCMRSKSAQLAGVALLAAWWTLPVAATSLLLMDPYITARSLSLPLSLFAIGYALDDQQERSRSLIFCALYLTLAFLFHPLMTAYAADLILLLLIMRLRRPSVALALLILIALAIAEVIQLHAPPESSALQAAEFTRYYWFLSQWRWYEYLGIIGPLIVLGLIQRLSRRSLTPPAIALSRACITLGVLAVLFAALFARENLQTHLLARLQPLRAFVFVYAVMTMLLGATLNQLASCYARNRAEPNAPLLPASLARGMPVVLILAAASIMFFVQRSEFPASQHLELPWRIAANPNPWVRAFRWVRENTPREALFAIDADYITTPGEDAQTFRATAQRSVLPDHSKDGGEASITPTLADAWKLGADAQQNLSALSDKARDARLLPFGVTWTVLHSSAYTAHRCPYDNGVVKVCRLDP